MSLPSPDVILSTSLASYLDRMDGSSWGYSALLINLVEPQTLAMFLCTANVVLEGACERVTVRDLYSDIPLGLYMIRGENVVLIGELDLHEDLSPHMTCVSAAEIKIVSATYLAQKEEREVRDLQGSLRKRMEFLDLD
ncbi:unnamed protein product [Ilex paraguariensis]|uniref:Sm domain-containing protein n=1 Tax=Ilex paraguariensis TaxID=185542 RepID=A0ABC8SWZ5_9AQUA